MCEDHEKEAYEESQRLRRKLMLNLLLPHLAGRFFAMFVCWYVLGKVKVKVAGLSMRVLSLVVLLSVMLARTFNVKPPPGLEQFTKERIKKIRAKRDKEVYARFEDKDAQMERAERLSKAIQIETVSYDTDDEDNETDYKTFDTLNEFFEESYPLVHKHLERHIVNEYSRIYCWKGSDENQAPYMLYAHMDVVPCPEIDSWSQDPFEGKITPGVYNGKEQMCIWGRGAIDDKQACLAYLEAVEDLLSSGFQPKRTLYICMGHDEEVSGTRGAEQIAVYLENEIGLKRVEFLCDEGLMVLQGVVPGYRKPVAMIGVSEKGSLNLKFTVKTAPGHSSSPEAENSSIAIMARAMHRLELNQHPTHFDRKTTGGTFEGLLDELSFPLRFVISNLWLFRGTLRRLMGVMTATKSSVRTTTAITIFRSGQKMNALPEEAVAYVNHRVHPGDTLEEVIQRNREYIDDRRIKIETVNSIPPAPVTDFRSSAFQDLKYITNEVYPDVSVVPGLFVANSDSKSFWNFTDQIYRYNPIKMQASEISMFHGIDERIGVDQFSMLALFWRRFIEKTDAREVSKNDLARRKSTKEPRKYITLRGVLDGLVHDTTAIIEEIAQMAESNAAFILHTGQSFMDFVQGLKR